ncbi:MAG: hypothetical protein ABI321_24365 [Polyangia bacterium]
MKSVFALAVVLVASTASADETEVTFAYVPTPNVEKVVVVQPLGRLTVRGWDRQEVRIAATKRAPDHAGLERLRVRVDLKSGRLEIVTGVRVGEVLRPIPTDAGYLIDLAVDVPSEVQVDATTFDGDLDAVGLRAGVVLSTTGGAIHATDIDGSVHATATRGRQRLAAIRGDVDADVLSGALELDSIEGAVLHATVVSGPVAARRIHSRVVEIVAAHGDIQLAGGLPLGGRWVLRAPTGSARITLEGVPMSLVLHAGRRLDASMVHGEHVWKLDRPGSARLLEADVGQDLELR